MGCQKDIAEAIVSKKADYLLAVKGNQSDLYSAIKKRFREQDPQSTGQQFEKSHGRLESREYEVLTVSARQKDFKGWKNIKTIGRAVIYQKEKGKEATVQYRYYISCAELTAEQFGDAVRGHWEIETSLHWVLDMAFSEDDCQIYRDNRPENMAILRQLSLNIMRAEPTKKSIRRKRKQACMDILFLEQALYAGIEEIGKN